MINQVIYSCLVAASRWIRLKIASYCRCLEILKETEEKNIISLFRIQSANDETDKNNVDEFNEVQSYAHVITKLRDKYVVSRPEHTFDMSNQTLSTGEDIDQSNETDTSFYCIELPFRTSYEDNRHIVEEIIQIEELFCEFEESDEYILEDGY